MQFGNFTSHVIQTKHTLHNYIRKTITYFFNFHCLLKFCCLGNMQSGKEYAATLCNPMDHSTPRYSLRGVSPDQNTGVGCYSLLQGIIPTQGSNPGLPHCRWILYHLSHQGSPLISCNDQVCEHCLSQSFIVLETVTERNYKGEPFSHQLIYLYRTCIFKHAILNM